MRWPAALLSRSADVRSHLVTSSNCGAPGVSLSSDFITGFCGETEQDHQDTLDLLEYVQYDQAFLYAYSMREKTNAHRKLVDDVPEATKKQRLAEAIRMFEIGAAAANQARKSINWRAVLLRREPAREHCWGAPTPSVFLSEQQHATFWLC